jgi:hypothetical protein
MIGLVLSAGSVASDTNATARVVVGKTGELGVNFSKLLFVFADACLP